jgi:acetyl esterase/lipase
VLETLSTPSIWVEGERDRSVPMAQTLAALDRLQKAGRPITVVRVAGADHSLMSREAGEHADFWPRVRAWLEARGVLVPGRPEGHADPGPTKPPAEAPDAGRRRAGGL